MLPAIELQARIVQIRNLAVGESIAHTVGWIAKRPTRVALVSVGYADGYPRVENGNNQRAIIGGRPCPLAGRASADLLAIDVTDIPDPKAARLGEMATLIGGEMTIDSVAAAAKSTGSEVLCHIGRRFRRIYHAS
jgi:alanine racemase